MIDSREHEMSIDVDVMCDECPADYTLEDVWAWHAGDGWYCFDWHCGNCGADYKNKEKYVGDVGP